MKSLNKIKPKIISILKEKGVKRAGIFGSYARNEQKSRSDIDILIEVPSKMDLYAFVGTKLDLQESLHNKVDLLSYKGIHPKLRKEILEQEIRII